MSEVETGTLHFFILNIPFELGLISSTIPSSPYRTKFLASWFYFAYSLIVGSAGDGSYGDKQSTLMIEGLKSSWSVSVVSLLNV